ncbi:hypothetical protein IF188_18765 [Microbacterium sp. NEAU-LLC]|uniref:DUF4386 domain-containing protein n=1 Tax=Microbacterium helvum TaxID=2773713 RepID=A0ABR8NUA5_9MICO|nr:hypothetical protein [Microbacterium helvum]MBD3943739.1 hypothetical protein [Microbacterium helvum]
MRTSLRVAGWGTLGFAIAFFAMFVINALINTVFVQYPEHPLAADMAADFGLGVLGTVLWSVCGVALGIATVGLAAVAWRGTGLTARVCLLFGAVATAGWMLSGAAILAQRTPMLNANIAAEQADPAAEGAVIEGLYLGIHLGGILFAIAAVPWLAIAAVGAARRVSKTVAVMLWIAAVGPFAGFAILGAQFGFLVVMVCFAVAGPILLRRARRTDAADPVAPVAADAVGA